jgi:predicted DCC family thiol-disulfide oxidoreductase YuxK
VGTLVFDGRCGFCTRSAGWLRRLDRRGRLTLRPYQDADVLAAAGLTVEQASRSVWWLDPDGSVVGGAHAVNAALTAAIGVRLPLWLYRLTRPLQERLYAWVAANRYRLPGATPYCTEHPSECGPGSD